MIRYFISDLHLSDERSDLIRAFVVLVSYLIEQKKQHDQDCELYVIGDFYERWIGDDDRPLWKDEVENALLDLVNNDIRLIFFHGNRDFLLDETWSQRVGAILIEDSLVIEEGDQRLFLSHGDEACLDDVEYQKFRTMVRDPQWKTAFLAKPLSERMAITQQLRDKSKTIKMEKALDIMDVNIEEINNIMQANQCRFMIHGHTHRPALHQEQSGYRIVLGDWHTHAWLGVLEQGHFKQLKIELDTLLTPVDDICEAVQQSDVFHELAIFSN